MAMIRESVRLVHLVYIVEKLQHTNTYWESRIVSKKYDEISQTNNDAALCATRERELRTLLLFTLSPRILVMYRFVCVTRLDDDAIIFLPTEDNIVLRALLWRRLF